MVYFYIFFSNFRGPYILREREFKKPIISKVETRSGGPNKLKTQTILKEEDMDFKDWENRTPKKRSATQVDEAPFKKRHMDELYDEKNEFDDYGLKIHPKKWNMINEKYFLNLIKHF